MAPLKVEFMRKQADKLEQAKAAYDQLNEQLMSELPQLIDLRYVLADIANKAKREPSTDDFCDKQSPLPRPHIRSARQNPTALLRGSLQSHGASATIPRCFDSRPVRQWRSRRAGGGCAGPDSRAEYCGDCLDGTNELEGVFRVMSM
jgi:hypothetical protein